MYETVEDARTYISNSIIRHKGVPVRINNISEGGRVIGHTIPDLKPVKHPMEDKGWNIRPIQLGYAEMAGGWVYLSRIPRRKWKQGLHEQSVHIISGGTRHPVALDEVNLPGLVDKHYPSLNEAVEMSEEEGNTVAFSPNFAIKRAKVFYKGREVGEFNHGYPRLSKEFNWLREALEEAQE